MVGELPAMVIRKFIPKMPTSPTLPNIISVGQLLETVWLPPNKAVHMLLISQFYNP